MQFPAVTLIAVNHPSKPFFHFEFETKLGNYVIVYKFCRDITPTVTTQVGSTRTEVL